MRVVQISSDQILDADHTRIAERVDPAPGHDELLDDYPLVLVTWHDAFFDFDQLGPDDCRPDYVVRTVGFLIHEGPRFVSIAQEVLPDGEGFRAVTHIPTSIVEGVIALHAGPTAMTAGEAG